MRWASFVYRRSKQSFGQYLQSIGASSVRSTPTTAARRELHRVVYTFKPLEDAQAEVAEGTQFPGIALRGDGSVRQLEQEVDGDGKYCGSGAVDAVRADPAPSTALTAEFADRGFVEFRKLIPQETASELAVALDAVLAGQFDTGEARFYEYLRVNQDWCDGG